MTPYQNTCQNPDCGKTYGAWMPPNVSLFCSTKCQTGNAAKYGPIRPRGSIRYSPVERVETAACAWAFDLGMGGPLE